MRDSVVRSGEFGEQPQTPPVPERKQAPQVPPKPGVDKKSLYSMPEKSMFDSDSDSDNEPTSKGKANSAKSAAFDAYSVPGGNDSDDDDDDRFSDQSGAYNVNRSIGHTFNKKKVYADLGSRSVDDDDDELLIDEEEPEEEELERVEEDDFLSDSDSDDEDDDKSGDWNQRYANRAIQLPIVQSSCQSRNPAANRAIQLPIAQSSCQSRNPATVCIAQQY
jgi:hypothetical protein